MSKNAAYAILAALPLSQQVPDTMSQPDQPPAQEWINGIAKQLQNDPEKQKEMIQMWEQMSKQKKK